MLAWAAVAGAGCLDDAGPAPLVRLAGSFTPERTAQDLEDFDRTVRAFGVQEYQILESYPEQFSLRVEAPRCHALQDALQAKAYLASVRGCPPA